MKIRYLGTSAAEAVPAMFCGCDFCRLARKAGGKNIRTRSQALIDGKLLIDFGPDTNYHSLEYGIALSEIQTCIVTHSHYDHLYVEDIKNRKPGFSHLDKNTPPLAFFGLKPVINIIYDFLKKCNMQNGDDVRVQAVKCFEPFFAEGFRITALPAMHDTHAGAVFYMIEKDGKTMLYAHDTGLFTDSVWDFFTKTAPHFDFVSLDCTSGSKPMNYDTHMNSEKCRFIKDRMISDRYASEKTVFCLNHFSHNGLEHLYEDFCALPQNEGFIVSYDGMEVEF